MSRLTLPALAIALALPAVHATDPPPPPGTGGGNQEELEPEVRIYETDRETIEEYRVNGEVYMVKIVPKVGKPYYLVDNDGDGRLESRFEGGPAEAPGTPQWILFSW